MATAPESPSDREESERSVSAQESPVGSSCGAVRPAPQQRIRKTHSVYVESWKDGEKVFEKAGNLLTPAVSKDGLETRDKDREEEEEEEEEEEWDYHWNPSREAEEDTLQPKFFKFL